MSKYILMKLNDREELRLPNNHHFGSAVTVTYAAHHLARIKETPYVVLKLTINENGWPIVQHYATVSVDGITHFPSAEDDKTTE